MKDIRLDKYVSVALGVTRSQAKSLIKNKAIKVFDEIIKTGASLPILFLTISEYLLPVAADSSSTLHT